MCAHPPCCALPAGRLLHHLEEVTGLSLRAVEYAVLDEADRLFEMGFMEQVRICGCVCAARMLVRVQWFGGFNAQAHCGWMCAHTLARTHANTQKKDNSAHIIY